MRRLSTNGRAALWYAEHLGWRVFPCHSLSGPGVCTCKRGKLCHDTAKHPMITENLKNATTSEFKIRSWWARWPFANIGIACGIDSGIWVLDVDPIHRGDESLDMLRELVNIPDTLLSQTGGGGWHFIFAHPGDEYRIANKQCITVPAAKHLSSSGELDLPGLDVRGDGGYIIAPPSAHVKGQYRWEASSGPHQVRISATPESLLRFVAKTNRGKYKADLPDIPPDDPSIRPSFSTISKMGQLIDDLKGARKGQLHQSRFDAGLTAGRLCAGGLVGSGAAIEGLIEAAVSNMETTLDHKEIEKDIVDGFRAGLKVPWTKEHPDAPQGVPPPGDDDAPYQSVKETIQSEPDICIKAAQDKLDEIKVERASVEKEREEMTHGMPEISISNRHPIDIIDDIWAEVLAWNEGEQRLLLRSGAIHEKKYDSINEIEYLQRLSIQRCYGWLIRIVGFTDHGVPVEPPDRIVRDILEFPSDKLPEEKTAADAAKNEVSMQET